MTYSQILESQRRLNLSNVLKLFSLQQNKSHLTLKQFIQTFSPVSDEVIDIFCNPYIDVIHDLNSINLEIHFLQSIVFIGGHAVYSYLETTSCHYSIRLLFENKDIEITDSRKSDPVRHIDRGSLKWASGIVIESIVVLWEIFIKIDEGKVLKKLFYSSPSRNVNSISRKRIC